MAQRVTLRKRTPYNTTSNRRRVVKTPGGKLVYHHLKKLATSPKCGDCGIALPGVCISLSFRRAYQLNIQCDVHRFLRSAPVNTLPSPRQGRLSAGRTVAHDAVTASSLGTYLLLKLSFPSVLCAPLTSILRAFLVEEAKIVKKVIKSQEKGGRK